MPIKTTINHKKKMIYSRISGKVKMSDFDVYLSNLETKPEFDPDYDYLLDLSSIQVSNIPTEKVRELAKRKIFSQKSRRAIVADQEYTYGLSRMYEVFVGLPSNQICIFKTLQGAHQWLDSASTPSPDKKK